LLGEELHYPLQVCGRDDDLIVLEHPVPVDAGYRLALRIPQRRVKPE
jgi:hypothetical protein